MHRRSRSGLWGLKLDHACSLFLPGSQVWRGGGGGVKFQHRAYAGRGQKERLVRVGTASVGYGRTRPLPEMYTRPSIETEKGFKAEGKLTFLWPNATRRVLIVCTVTAMQ